VFEKLLWLSDLHLVAKGCLVAGHDPTATIERAMRNILRHHSDAKLLILSGDIADDGQKQTYEHLKALIANLPMPVLPMMGNHDERAALIDVFSPPVSSENGTVDFCIEIASGTVVCLDTKRPGADSGLLTDAQLDWIDERLKKSADRPAYIFMHHPPIDLGLPTQDRDRLANGEALIEIFKRHSNVKHLFFGHVHRPVSGSIGTLPFTVMSSLLFQAPLPYPNWDWPNFRPAEDLPALGIILLNRENVIVHYQQLGGADTQI
jgi:3',5'-cyclic-AMP phosphodiesterase